MDVITLLRTGFLGAFVVLCLATIRYLVSLRQLEKYLEQHHPETWQSLGRPNLIWNNSPIRKLAFMRYLKSPEAQNHEDAGLSRLVRKTRGLFLVGTRAGLMMIVLFVLVVYLDPAGTPSDG